MALLVLTRGIEMADSLRAIAPDRDIRYWPETGDKQDIRYALVWRHPPGELTNYPNLQAIFSVGAGVDQLMGDKALPDVPIVRFVDPDLTMRMREFAVLHVLLHHRQMLDHAEHQARREWVEIDHPSAGELRVGVMGLGTLGSDSARALAAIGYRVAGWARSAKEIDGVEIFAGSDRLDAFLARTDILVCLLPLTSQTRGILNRALFAKLAKDGPLPGPVLVNAGRGALQVETDILQALDTGALWACSLDVFEEEPLPAASPLWAHPRIVVTPHTASISSPRAVSRYVLGQIDAHEAGRPLENVVDRKRGY